MSEVCVFLADGFEEIEGLTVVDVLRRAGISVETVSVMEKKKITGSHKILVKADKKFENILAAKAEVAPGDTIYEITYAPNRLTYCVNTAKGGIAVFSEIYFPWGWKAEIDGERLTAIYDELYGFEVI